MLRGSWHRMLIAAASLCIVNAGEAASLSDRAVSDRCHSFLRQESESAMHPELDIRAVMYPGQVPVDGDAAIRLTLLQQGQKPVSVPHPLLSTEALLIHVELPSGEERTVRTPPARPGVPRRQAMVTLQPQVMQTFGISMKGVVAPLSAGTYCFVLEYPWASGHIWRSPPLSLTVE
jgi:hypothetical protein